MNDSAFNEAAALEAMEVIPSMFSFNIESIMEWTAEIFEKYEQDFKDIEHQLSRTEKRSKLVNNASYELT